MQISQSWSWLRICFVCEMLYVRIKLMSFIMTLSGLSVIVILVIQLARENFEGG